MQNLSEFLYSLAAVYRSHHQVNLQALLEKTLLLTRLTVLVAFDHSHRVVCRHLWIQYRNWKKKLFKSLFKFKDSQFPICNCYIIDLDFLQTQNNRTRVSSALTDLYITVTCYNWYQHTPLQWTSEQAQYGFTLKTKGFIPFILKLNYQLFWKLITVVKYI